MLSESKAKLISILKLSTLRRRLDLVQSREQELGGTSEDLIYWQIPEKELLLFRRLISQANELVSQSDGRLYFVYLPAWERYGYPPNARKDRDRILSTIKSLNIPVIDIHSAFASQRDPLALFPFRRFGHYNEQGHRLVAEELLRALASAKPIGLP
jgi:hypothetical protein